MSTILTFPAKLKKKQGLISLESINPKTLNFTPSSSSSSSSSSSTPQIITLGSNLVKHQYSPASHSKCIINLEVADSDKNIKFEVNDRADLEAIRSSLQSQAGRAVSPVPPNGQGGPSSGPSSSSGMPKTLIDSNSNSNLTPQLTDSLSSYNVPISTRWNNIADDDENNARQAPSFNTLTIDVTEVRERLLATDPELKEQYHDLVTSKIVTPEDFWSNPTNKKKVADDCARNFGNYNKGKSTKLVSDIEITKHVDLKSPEVIAHIFVMYPAVKALYEEKVPDPLDDKRFWDLYLKSEYFRSDKGAGVFNNSNSNSNSSNDMFTVKENQLREKRKREEAKVNRVKVGEAKRTKKLMGSDVIGVKVDEFDLAASFGGERDAGQKVKRVGDKIVDKYKRHWVEVLAPMGNGNGDGDNNNNNNNVNVDDERNLHEINGQALQDSIELVIRDESLYSSKHITSTTTTTGTTITPFTGLSPTTTPNFFSSRDSKSKNSVQIKLGKMLADASSAERNKKSMLSVVNKDLKAKFYKYLKTTSELLRHFYPLQTKKLANNMNSKEQKRLERIVARITENHSKLHNEREKLNNESGEHELGEILVPLLEQYSAAVESLEERKGFA